MSNLQLERIFDHRSSVKIVLFSVALFDEMKFHHSKKSLQILLSSYSSSLPYTIKSLPEVSVIVGFGKVQTFLDAAFPESQHSTSTLEHIDVINP